MIRLLGFGVKKQTWFKREIYYCTRNHFTNTDRGKNSLSFKTIKNTTSLDQLDHSPASTPAMYSRLIRKMPWTISNGTPIISCSKALNPSCSKLKEEREQDSQDTTWYSSSLPTTTNQPDANTRTIVPNVHKHVAEEAPHLCTVARVVHQGALHEVRLIGLQYPLVQHDAVAHEHNNLWHRTKPKGQCWCSHHTLVKTKKTHCAFERNLTFSHLFVFSADDH